MGQGASSPAATISKPTVSVEPHPHCFKIGIGSFEYRFGKTPHSMKCLYFILTATSREKNREENMLLLPRYENSKGRMHSHERGRPSRLHKIDRST